LLPGASNSSTRKLFTKQVLALISTIDLTGEQSTLCYSKLLEALRKLAICFRSR
jgi:hypothetical protein